MSINPALADLEPLLGRWGMEMFNAAALDPGVRVTGSMDIDSGGYGETALTSTSASPLR
jgi:hypothetical protein